MGGLELTEIRIDELDSTLGVLDTVESVMGFPFELFGIDSLEIYSVELLLDEIPNLVEQFDRSLGLGFADQGGQHKKKGQEGTESFRFRHARPGGVVNRELDQRVLEQLSLRGRLGGFPQRRVSFSS